MEFAEPRFSDHDPATVAFSELDGAVLTGSGAALAPANPVSALCERAFAAGTPVFGSGRGAILGAAILGAEIGPERESEIARGLVPAGHPMTAGRRERFDALIRGGESIARAPSGALVAARDATGAPEALASGDGVFWGCLYQPEAGLTDLAYWLARTAPRVARAIAKIAEDPAVHARLLAKHRISLDLIDEAYRRTELANWLAMLETRRSP